MRTLFTLLLLLIFCFDGQPQDKKTYNYSISALADYGFLIGHHAEMNRLSTRHFPSFRLYFGHKTAGSKNWHQDFKYPELGLGVYYSPLMFNDQLGEAYAVFGYLEQILGNKERNNFTFRFGFGPGWLTSKFESKENNQNTAIGNTLNIFVFFEFQKAFKLSKTIDAFIGINISHFSNTGVQMPNLGINLMSGQLGLKYRIGEQALISEYSESEIQKQWTHEAILSIGRKQSGSELAKTTVINARYQAIYSLSLKSSLIGSGDLFFELADDYQYEYQKVENSFQAGVAVGYLHDMKQIQASLQWGFYLYNKNPDYAPYYHRLGIKWVATEKLLVNLSLRTEWARARNVELGLGWRF